MARRKHYIAFLSFSEPDRPLAEAIKGLFSQLQEQVFFAPTQLPQAGPANFPDAIISGIMASHCFVPVYTVHSLKRPWVLYESGLADSLELPRFPVRVVNVTPEEITRTVPSRTQPHYFAVYEKNELVEFAINVCLSKHPKREQKKFRRFYKERVESELAANVYARQILSLAKQRWVFIAGNTPRGTYQKKYTLKWAAIGTKNYNPRLRAFVKRLTVALLNDGFSLCSCPQVQPVGEVVAAEAAKWLAKHNGRSSNFSDYRIGGIYPVDLRTRESRWPKDARDLWLKRLMDFRRSYLADQEWLILIGGSEGTQEEHKAAKNLNDVRVFSIPCFGGAARKVWNNLKPRHKGPCRDCSKMNGQCTPNNFAGIIEYLKKG